MRTLRGPTSPDTLQRVDLDGREFILRWRWVERGRRWALDVSTADGTLLAGGIAVVVNAPLLTAVRAARPEMPPGDLIVYDSRPRPSEPGLEDLGGETARIVYLEAADLSGPAPAPVAEVFIGGLIDV